MVMALKLQFCGHGFDFLALPISACCSHTCASVTKQYNLALLESSDALAGKVCIP